MKRLKDVLMAGAIVPVIALPPLGLEAAPASMPALIVAQAAPDAAPNAASDAARPPEPRRGPAGAERPSRAPGAEPGAPRAPATVPAPAPSAREPAGDPVRPPAQRPPVPRPPEANPARPDPAARSPSDQRAPAPRQPAPNAPAEKEPVRRGPAEADPAARPPAVRAPDAPVQPASPPPPRPQPPAATAPKPPAPPAPPAAEPPKPAMPAPKPDAARPTPPAPPPVPAAPPPNPAPATPPAAPPPAAGRPAPPPPAPAVPAPVPGQAAPNPAAPSSAAPPQPPPGQVAPGPVPGSVPGQTPPPTGRSGSRIGPGGAAAIGAAAGLVGGFLAADGVNRLDDVRGRRQRSEQDGVTVIREPGRTIVEDGGRRYIRHDEIERFRELPGDVRSERRGAETYSTYARPGGEEIVTVTDEDGRLLRRVRRTRDGREVVIIDNARRGRPASFDDEVVTLPPPPMRIPRDRYIVDAEGADETVIYETLSAPPVAPVPRRYTLDEVRRSPDLRAYTRSVDVDTINFDTGSWEVARDQARRLAVIAKALNEAVRRNPNEVFLIEGHTDAVGQDVDNLSLSDRRAQSVAAILTRDFEVPPENLTTQGYGEQYLKVGTQAAERENRRVTLRRITPLLTGQNGK